MEELELSHLTSGRAELKRRIRGRRACERVRNLKRVWESRRMTGSLG